MVDGNEPLQYTEEVSFKAEITEEELEDPPEVFFSYMFPSRKGMCYCFVTFFVFSNITYLYSFFFMSLSGHAKITDNYYLCNPLATYYDTVARDKIVFHDEESEDPDWKVRQCYLLIIAAATEPFTGIEIYGRLGNPRGIIIILTSGNICL